jgi:hypothetical protein
MKKLIALILISLLIPIPSASANNNLAIIKETNIVTGSTSVTPNIWQGNIPTKIGIRQYSNYIAEFTIQGLLAYETLGAKNSRGTGVIVEFEIWTSSGKKLTYDTIYSSDWNPVGPNTSVDFRFYDFNSAIGTHTLIIRTKYELSTTGLLTKYWEGKIQQPITIYDIDVQARIDAEALAKAKAEAEAKAKAEAELKAKQEAEAKAKAEADAKAKAQAEADAKAKAEADAKAEYDKFLAEQKAKVEAEKKAAYEAVTWTCRADLNQYYSDTYNKTVPLMNGADADIFCKNLWDEVTKKELAKKEAELSAMEAKRKLVDGTACKKLGSTKIAGGITFTCKKINKKLIWR